MQGEAKAAANVKDEATAPAQQKVRVNLADLADNPKRTELLAGLARPMRQGGTTGVAVWYFTTTSPCVLKPIGAAIDEFLTELDIPRLATRPPRYPRCVKGTRREDLAVNEPDSEDRCPQAHKAILEGLPDDGLAVILGARSFSRHGVPVPPALLGKVAAWLHSSKGARDSVVILITGGTYDDANSLAIGGRYNLSAAFTHYPSLEGIGCLTKQTTVPPSCGPPFGAGHCP